MQRSKTLLFFLIATFSLLSGCSGGNQQERVVEEYLEALVSKDPITLSTVTCAEWTPTAIAEMNSFQAVTATLSDLTCTMSGSDGEVTLVVCNGYISTSYDGEQQQIDLSARIWEIVEQNGVYLVCGYR
jgi:hypothetical protein